jgi:iron(III) transport system permease protein
LRGSRIPLIFSFLFLIIFSVPIFYLIYGSSFFRVGSSPTISWDLFRSILTSPATGYLLVNTLVFAIGGASLATVLAFVYAWILWRTDVPGKRLLELLPILPLTMPFVVKAFAWIYLFSPRIGLINILLRPISGVESVFNIYSMPGMIFAIGVGGLPLAFLTIEPAIKSLDPSLEEASRVAGNGVLKTLLRVTVPVLLPAIFSAFLLLMIIGLENFDYPFLLGNPAGIDTLATQVYFTIFEIQPPQYGAASIISIIYLIMTILTVSIYIYVTRKTFKFVVVTGKAARPSVHKLRRWKYIGLAVCFFILFFAFLLPYGTLVLMSVTPFYSAAGGVVQLTFTLDNFTAALNLSGFWTALQNSIGLGLAAGLIGTLIASFLSYAALKSKVRGARFVDLISSIPLAFPGIVYGLALFWTFLLIPGSGLIYGTIWPLVIALVFIRLPYCVRMISGSLIQIANELEESSRVAGASWGRTFYKIVLPLMRRGMVNSFVYTFINSLRELGAVVLLVTAQSVVVTTLLLNLYSQHALALHPIAAASVFLSIFIMIALALPTVVRHVSAFRRGRAEKLKPDVS